MTNAEAREAIKEAYGNSEYTEEIIKALEQEPCNDVCEWFEQYVDIATDIVEVRFSDGTVKRAKRGLYLHDIEKSIRKMLIDQIANEKKQEPKWIPVSERLPEKNMECLVSVGIFNLTQTAMYSNLMGLRNRRIFYQGEYGDDNFEDITQYVKAWMPLPAPFESQESEE